MNFSLTEQRRNLKFSCPPTDKSLAMQYFTLVALIFFFSYAGQASELTDLLKPSPLEKIDWDSSLGRQHIQEKIGKADLKENNINYYSVQKIKYPLSIEFNDEKSKRIYYRYINQKLHLTSLQKYLKKFNKVEIKGPDAELYYELVSPDKKIKLRFSVIDHSLYSVERWY